MQSCSNPKGTRTNMDGLYSESENFVQTETTLDNDQSVEVEDSGSGGNSESDPDVSPLIPGLPDDIALFCLARVPRRYHALLKCVSRKWRNLVCGEEWYSYRKKHHLQESWIYALGRDKSEQLCCYVLDPTRLKRGWKPILGLPHRCIRRKGVGFEVLGKKLFLFGGCGWIEDATNEVYCYDAAMNTWNQAASLVVPRCYCVSEVFNEKIFAIGGIGPNSNNLPSWETYNPETMSWTLRENSNIFPDIEDSIVLDGKIYIRGVSSPLTPAVPAFFFEPSSTTWQPAAFDLASGWHGPAVVVGGMLYVLDQSSGTRLMMWQKDIRQWVAVGRLSPLLTKPPCRLVAVGNDIFIIGKGLSTVVFNVENARNMDGVLMSTSIPKSISDDDVISCKAITI
ncbi:PREDICTED: F-box/kelch-repeat protein SKIP4 [Nicotiana attenuata]|uniref:F-boxkelch-repeat protein skip4 n=1 Tax=Nicotiana attenuata TaxID=49451 RepID=A0A314KTE6_NICAT|nr:PREDICTED: F-box/kelch-repeat protein SKIP4 [Nicotiana attenuata]OIT32019.1 f-boxkelch-repeat protein skip4 [Nicotiana attenuata]